MPSWFKVNDTTDLLSPSLIIDRGLVARNIQSMIALAGSPDRLRPHVKTHKMPAIIRLCTDLGITRHKCATIAEAEMVANAGGHDILLAYPLVGPNIARYRRLIQAFPLTTFRALVDDPSAARALSEEMTGLAQPLPVLLDLDVGMGRTGIPANDDAVSLYELLRDLPNLIPDGLSLYDGHIHDIDPAARKAAALPGIILALTLRDRLHAKNLPVPRLVLGGTPTFPIHAELSLPGVECSPGTSVLHDFNYATRYPDLPFTPAAALLTRVISRPRTGRLCLDLGHKAVAADPAGPRVFLPALPDATLSGQSEEHLIVDTPDAHLYPPGTPFLAFPAHVCPTCALHRRAYVVEAGALVDVWEVAARDRVLQF